MSYAQMHKKKGNTSPLQKGTFSNDHKFYQELTQKLWESKPADENTHPDVQYIKTKRATNYLTDESQLLLENRKLKETIISMKLEMKSKLESDLLKQKREFQEVLKEYVQFIDKILQDKKDLQTKLDEIQNQEKCCSEESIQHQEEFNSKLSQIESLLSQLEHEKTVANDKIDKLKQQNSQMKLQHEQQILDIKEQNYQDFQKFEQIVQSALQKKDEKIRKLREQLNIQQVIQ